MTWNAPTILGLVLAAGLLLAGVAVLWGRGASTLAHRVAAGLREPTRLVTGLCLLVLGYHALAYALPAGWITLRVPASRWWLLAGGVGLAVGGTVLAEVLERSIEQRDGGGPGA